ncbi:MAG: GNAT family N-acetyltransferase [Candidatus Bipolaricaulia bacterium]
MDVRIRPFTPEEYETIVEIGNRIFPDYPETVEEVRYGDEHRDPKCRFQRYVAEHEESVVAFGSYDQSPWMYHPQKFKIEVYVDPDHQGRGIGSALYGHIMTELEPFNPITARSFAREDYDRSVRFLKKRGFVEVMRDWESRLDVQTFDFTPYEGHIERVEVHGIRLVPLSELEDDLQRDHKLYELEDQILQDVPMTDRYTPVSFELFVERTLKNPNLLPEAYYVALDEDRYVGTSGLWKSQANQDLYTGLTGVLREYRRRGIALALKLKGLAYAKEHGYPVIKTWNETGNRAMLTINEQLGFVKQPAWIDFAKELGEETDAAPDRA